MHRQLLPMEAAASAERVGHSTLGGRFPPGYFVEFYAQQISRRVATFQLTSEFKGRACSLSVVTPQPTNGRDMTQPLVCSPMFVHKDATRVGFSITKAFYSYRSLS